MKKFFEFLRTILLCALFQWMIYLHTESQGTFYVATNGTVSVCGKDATHPTLYTLSPISIAVNGAIKNIAGRTYLSQISNSGTYDSDSLSEDHFVGTGSASISGNFSGISHLGNVYKENLGALQANTNVDCFTTTFSTPTSPISTNYIWYVKSFSENAISGFDSTRFFNVGTQGTLARNISLVGATYAFPVAGSSVDYRRLDVILSLLVGGGGVVSVKLITPSGVVDYSHYFTTGFSGTWQGGVCTGGNRPQQIDFSCIGFKGWNISLPANDTYNVVGYLENQSDVCGPGPRRILRSPANSGLWTNYVDTVVGNVASDMCSYIDWTEHSLKVPGGTYSGGGDFAVASGSAIALPVELINFTADAINNSFIQVSWSTDLEINNQGFIVTKSLDGALFDSIGFVDGQGNSTTLENFMFDDYQVEGDIDYYYQLQQVDYNGRKTFSNIVHIRFQRLGSISLYPNPARDHVSLSMGSVPSQTVEVSIKDLLGREVLRVRTFLVSADPISLEIGSFARGVYVITCLTENGSKTFQLVKE